MARLAILIDGAYLQRVAQDFFDASIDYSVLPGRIRELVAADASEPLDLLRTYFYDALPYMPNNASTEDAIRRSQKERFFTFLRRLPKYDVREGWVAYRGRDSRRRPIYQQKQVDVLLGLDIALLSTRRLITHMALVAGDSDLAPAVVEAQREGVVVWLFHGGIEPSSGTSSVARSLVEQVDMRQQITREFMDQVKR